MHCDRCNRTIEGEAMVSLGSRRRFKSLCRGCWTIETRNSNSRLIAALNELTRRGREERAAAASGDQRKGPDLRERRDHSERMGGADFADRVRS